MNKENNSGKPRTNILCSYYKMKMTRITLVKIVPKMCPPFNQWHKLASI